MFDHCMYFNTTALARLVEREWTKAFEAFGLTPPQGFALRVVLARPGLPQRELAGTLSISRPTATRLLDGLQAKRLVERCASARDGRESEIYPTAAAADIKDALNTASGTVTKRIKQTVGRKTFDDTVTRLRSIRSALG